MPKDATVRLVFGADTAEAEAALGKLKSQIGNFGSALTSAGATLSAAFTAPVAGLIKLASSFDEAMDKIRARTGAAGQALANLGDVFRKVYSSVPTSIEAASTAISDLATKANLSGKSLEDVSKAVLELSRLTGADLNSTIDASAKLFMNWGIQADQMVSILDFLFKVSQSTGVGIDQLNANLASYGSMLREYGFSLEEAATMIGAFSKQGVELDKVMTGLRIALTEFAKAGISDAAGALEAVTDQIKNAGSAAEANSIAIQIFGARAGPYLAQQIREGRLEWQELLKTLQQSPETIGKAAQDTMSLSEKLSLLKQHAALALEPLGKKLVDIVEQQLPNLEGAIRKVIEVWNNLGESGQSALVKAATYLAVGGPILIGLGAVASALKNIIGLLGLITSSPVVAVLLGVAAAVGAIAISIANARSQVAALEAQYGPEYVAALQAGTYGQSLNAKPWLAATPTSQSDVGTSWKKAGEDLQDTALRAFDTFKQASFAAQEAGDNAKKAGDNFDDFTGALDGTGDVAKDTTEKLTPLDKLLQAINADMPQFKPWTSTEYNLYQLKSMRDDYANIVEQIQTGYEWEKKAQEARDKQLAALKEMADLMQAERPTGGLYSSVSEILDSIISKYKTLIQAVQEGKPYVEPQWNVGQQALLEWLQSGKMDALLAQFAKGPSPLYPIKGEQQAMVTRFQDELGKVLEDANKKLFAELGLSIDYKTFKTLPSEIQDAVMKITQLRELQSQAEQAKKAAETQMDAANIMLQAARIFASAASLGAVSARAGGRANVMAMQSGGLVMSPTLALIGEKEPEYVIPARRLESLMESLLKKETPITIHIYSEDGKVKNATAQREAQLFAAYGVRA